MKYVSKEQKIEKQMKKSRIFVLMFVLQVIVLLSISITFAWLVRELMLNNRLTTHTTSINITENFINESPTSGTITKEVKFTNIGSSSVFLRVAYSETWIYSDPLENTKSYISSQIDNVDVAIKNFNFTDWTDGGDGWFYYNKILVQNSSTPLLLNSVTFPSFVGKFEKYENADYLLYIKAEAVQASDGSSTLNSAEVNSHATSQLFSKLAIIDSNGTILWQDLGGSE